MEWLHARHRPLSGFEVLRPLSGFELGLVGALVNLLISVLRQMVSLYGISRLDPQVGSG